MLHHELNQLPREFVYDRLALLLPFRGSIKSSLGPIYVRYLQFYDPSTQEGSLRIENLLLVVVFFFFNFCFALLSSLGLELIVCSDISLEDFTKVPP